MVDEPIIHYGIEINSEDPLYIISVVSELVGLPVWTLRKLDELGVVEPQRLGKKTRCYSLTQIKTLSYIQHLMNEKGVNISGIKIILEMGKEDADE